jgi:hypothetical protein
MVDRIGRLRVSRVIASCVVLLAALTYACSGGGSDTPTQPAPPVDRTPIRIIAGDGQTDTVGAVLAQELVAEIHDTAGKVFAGSTVRFTSIAAPNDLFVSPANVRAFSTVVNVVADAQGRAKALVALGATVGTVKLEVAVPTLGATDTVTYTVKAGAPAKFTISPRDTVIQPGTSYTLKVQTTDRYSNPISSAAPTLSATGVTVSPAGQVSATSVTARARIAVSYQGLSDSASVSVVPKFPMVVNRNNSVVLINTDGTGETTLAVSPSVDFLLSPSSVPATPSVVFHQRNSVGSRELWVAQPGVPPRLLLRGTTGQVEWPRLSPDGTWVYFVNSSQSLWRVHLDGTGLDSLTEFVGALYNGPPSISPDGGSVAVQDGNGIKIFDVATRTSTTVPVTCKAPRYSPDGAFFACLGTFDVSIVRTDGTGKRVVADLFSADPDDVSPVDWSPDGKWLLATTVYQGAVLVEVSSGAVLSLARVLGTPPQVREASFVR